jgi:hypothetical protein
MQAQKELNAADASLNAYSTASVAHSTITTKMIYENRVNPTSVIHNIYSFRQNISMTWIEKQVLK